MAIPRFLFSFFASKSLSSFYLFCFYPHDDMRVKKLLRYMYVCMYTSWHHIKFLVKYVYLSILVIRNVTVICMYVCIQVGTT